MKLLKFLINTNLLISIAAVLFTMEAQVQLGMRPSLHPYLFIIFFATLFEYNLHRLITITFHKKALQSPKHQWLRDNMKAFYLLVIVSITGFLVAIYYAKKEVLIALAPIAVLTLFYSLPVYWIKQRLLRLREVPFLKIFLISFIWGAVTVLLPVIQSGGGFSNTHVSLMIAERFFFILAITIPFDIRDMETDTLAGLKTIPLVFGVKKSIVVANAASLIFMIISAWHYWDYGMRGQVAAMVLSGLLTLYFLNSRKLQGLSYYHYGLLDGAIVIQGLLAGLFYFI